ncbi:peptidoglycan-binding domain-containing protein [Thalassospiraceae bacterium LMO-SO8]|nr:peptidoglycan-binding protein [Alphaproteobacteria bacterium LMO-S08]WND77856.1 peptidoglycan-binding domain-containing protein [Thalassospiraceae bacterium LMO-SO8]
MISPFKLNATLGRDYNADLDDTLRIKKALKKIGFFETPSYGMTEFPDEPLFKGIERFQEQYNLQKDGIMKPDGETAATLGAVLAEKDRQAALTANGKTGLTQSTHAMGTNPLGMKRATTSNSAPKTNNADNSFQLASLTPKTSASASATGPSKPNPPPENGAIPETGDKQVAAAIAAPLIPVLPEISSAVGALLGILGLTLPLKSDTSEDEERKRKCEEQVAEDEEICRQIAAKHGPRAAERCWASSLLRYGNCRVGRPIPPLDRGTD